MAFRYTPCRIVRGRCYHPYLVATLSKPLAHFAVVLSGAGDLRCIVDAVDQDAQGSVHTFLTFKLLVFSALLISEYNE